jgi:hypothetical protein
LESFHAEEKPHEHEVFFYQGEETQGETAHSVRLQDHEKVMAS